jgi:hypothetical protein
MKVQTTTAQKDASPLLGNQEQLSPGSNPNVPYVPPLANTFSQYLHPSTPPPSEQSEQLLSGISDATTSLVNLNFNNSTGAVGQQGSNVSQSNQQAPLVSTSASGMQQPYFTPQMTANDLFNTPNVQTTDNQPAVPMYSPTQFSNLPSPTPLPHLHNYAPQSSDGTIHPHVNYTPMNPYPFEPPTHPINSTTPQFNPALLTYSASQLEGVSQSTIPVHQQQISSYPPLQTYSSYPQVQGGLIGTGTAVTTPISLPGMPPITVSATISPQALEGIQFNSNIPLVSSANIPPTTTHN